MRIGPCLILFLALFFTMRSPRRELPAPVLHLTAQRVSTGMGQEGNAAGDPIWTAPDTALIPPTPEGRLIRYGRSLIASTAVYLGPAGRLARISNGMSCQNCHLQAGSKSWGNNFGAVYSMYPRFRERRGAVETIVQRVNDCFERSLNGKALDSASPEMRAMIAYMKWLGKDLPKGCKPAGSGIRQLKFMSRAADPLKGSSIYIKKCMSCHGGNGEGKKDPAGIIYQYPPLWGMHSYNTAAGLYRLSRFAGYVMDNMPFGASHQNPGLSEEEAWDIAAFVNSRPRPQKSFRQDWPNRALKPADHPFGPFMDPFSEAQHKYGPYDQILAWKKRMTASGLRH
ncbi:MAG TPA: c-type cytochrome [Puia sp.]|nr:c-type cytochrome [Puia sp.]